MGLIDADKLIEKIKEQKEKEKGAYAKGINNGLNIVISIINDKMQTPVVYDDNKVVKQLEEDCKILKLGNDGFTVVALHIEEALKILKAGGDS